MSRHGRQGRKLRLDFADSLNEKLRLRFPFAALRNLFHNRDILEPCGIGFGEVQGKLRAAGTEQFIKNAGREDNCLQIAAHGSAKRSRAKRGKTDGDACLRNEGQAQIVPHQLIFFDNKAAEPSTDIFADDTNQEVGHAYHNQRQGRQTR